MQRILLILLVLLIAGCGPVGVVPLGAMLGFAKKRQEEKPEQPAFTLTVDRLVVEGDATDSLDDKVNLYVNGNPVPVTAGTFSAQLNTQAQRSFVFRMVDDAGNTTERHVQVE